MWVVKVLLLVRDEATNRSFGVLSSIMGSSNRGFHIKNQVVPITVEDVYFLTGFSRRGLPIYLTGSTVGGETVRDYVMLYFYQASERRKY